MTPGAVAAVDLGATSGRVVVGRVADDRLELEEVHRFPDDPVHTSDGLHWDLTGLYGEVLIGLGRAAERAPDLVSVGIDSWAVDYGLVRAGRLIGEPFHYRDERTAQGVQLVHARVPAEELYAVNGLQFLPFNTLYQLAVDQAAGRLDPTTRMLLIPDLVAYWLTGEQRTERTNASTTGLLDVATREWSAPLVDRLGLPPSLLPPLVSAGDTVGRLTDDIGAVIGRPGLPVVAVGSHDTASAVAAAPLASANAAYLCSGTWSLIGVETAGPITTEVARRANFTNEGGVDGRNRFLRNVMGMWLVNESLADWQRAGRPADLSRLLPAAARVERFATFDATDPSLLPAGGMLRRIEALAPQLRGADPATVLRSILESLAAAYASTIDDLRAASGVPIDAVSIVGGASQNALLCQLIADHAGLPVHAGPVEATAAGSVLVQARAAGLVSGSLEDLRDLVRRSSAPTRYDPGGRAADSNPP